MNQDEVRHHEEEILLARGIRLEDGTTFAEMVALTLRIPPKQSDAFLEAMYNGATVEQAASAAGLDIAELQNEAMIEAAREIGAAIRLARARV